MKKHIITACSGYHPDQLSSFFRSLERIGFDGLVHAIIWDCDIRLGSFLERQNVGTSAVRIGRKPSRFVNRVARVVSRLPVMRSRNGGNSIIDSVAKSSVLRKSLPISSLRYLVAQNIVEKFASDSVFLLTDSRDVYFQKWDNW